MEAIQSPRAVDRRLSRAAAFLFPLIIVAGFARTYYLSPFSSAPPLPSVIVHVHGALMTAWVALFVTQIWLVSSRRVRVHRRLGYAGIGLAVLILATGTATAVRAAKYGSASTPPAIPPLQFMIVPMFDLLMFAVLFGGAVYYRRRLPAHRGLILLTALNFIPPALARIPAPALQALGPVWFFGVPTLLGIACLVVDARQRGGVNRVFAAGLALLVASYVVRLALMPTEAWLAVATWATSFV